MNNENYVLLVVPFISKNYKSFKENVFKIKGKCNFLIYLKDKSIVKQYIELEEANYRVTDYDMVKTSYWKQIDIKTFREKYIKTNKIEEKRRFETLTETKIKSINDYFKYQSNTTVLRQLSYLSGSNPSGAKKYPKASPLKCIDKDYLSFNFYNPLKKYQNKKHLFNQNISLKLIKKVSLSDIINSNQYLDNFIEEFYSYNWMYINLLDDENIKEKLNATIPIWKINKDVKEKDVEKQCLDKVEEIYNLYSKNCYNGNDGYKKQLRSIYKSWTKYLISINKLKEISQLNYISKEIIETAHIIGFSFLISSNKIEDWKLAVNGNNAIFIEPNYHKLFDKNIITFNPENRKIIVNTNNLEKNNIDKNIVLDECFLINDLSDEQIRNLEINYKYWKENNKNMN